MKKSAPPPEFYYLAEAYFHQDSDVLYKDLDDLIEDVIIGFNSYGSKAVLKRCLDDLTSTLSDKELEALWRSTNAQIGFISVRELRRALKAISAAL